MGIVRSYRFECDETNTGAVGAIVGDYCGEYEMLDAQTQRDAISEARRRGWSVGKEVRCHEHRHAPATRDE